MGGVEEPVPAGSEPSVKYHPCAIRDLTLAHEAGQRTVLGGQFDWGGLLPNSNGGVQRSVQRGWQSRGECKGTNRLNCETDMSNRYESRS